MSEAREREWRELFAFFEYWVTRFPVGVRREDPAHPLNYVNVVIQKYGRSGALEGLKQAVGDILESSSGLKGQSLIDLDEQLVAAGVVSLSRLRYRYWSKVRKVLKRGCIRSETEYHLLKALADDLSNDISDDERSTIDRLIHAFGKGV
jgi:hypothetical protein